MSVIKRLYNVAKGKAIVSRTPGHDPALAEEPPRPRLPAEAAEDDGTEEDIPTVESEPRPAGPRPRRL